jgi:DNA-binding cell septation regulator SpoVG
MESMRVLYSPIFNDVDTMDYVFEGDIITVTCNGVVDTFDFTNMPNGRAEEIKTHLMYHPIREAERMDGILHVVLRKFISTEADESELFPEWIEV